MILYILLTRVNPSCFPVGPGCKVDAVPIRREDDGVYPRAVLFASVDLLERTAMVSVGECQRLNARECGRQREFAQIRIIMHFDVQRILQADGRKIREIVVTEIPAK